MSGRVSDGLAFDLGISSLKTFAHLMYFDADWGDSHNGSFLQLCRVGLMKITDLITRWPVMQQILTDGDGMHADAMSQRTRNLTAKHHGAQVARSVCPYCAVGCGQLVYHKDGKLISIEGDPQSPISRGRLCPKGSDSFELLTHGRRETRVKYRRPHSTKWEELDLETAMDMIAERLWESRERTFVEKENGETVMHTTAIAHLGGATLDNEENYLIKKLFAAGLGMVCISNQARI
jgi:formate dehydrogenase major subunit